MRVKAGQEWELPSVETADPLVLRVVEVVEANDGTYAVVHTVRRSAPGIVLARSNMWVNDVISTGVLVAGPGSLSAMSRDARVTHLVSLLLYEARRSGTPTGDGDVRFDGQEVVRLVAEDEKTTRDQARAMLRDALASLEGREITSAYDRHEIGYVIPSDRLRSAA